VLFLNRGDIASFSFDRYVLDVRRGTLLHGGVEQRLRPKPAMLLRYLVEQAGKLVGRDEIAAVVWPGQAVSNASIDQCVRAIRQALGDDGREVLQTVPKRGYLLAPRVTRHTPAASETIAPGPVTGAGVPMLVPPRLSIAVMPFHNLSGDPDNGYFVDGFVEEIITSLSSVPLLFIVARASSFSVRQHAVDGAQAGRDLGVRYVLEGSVRKAGKELRITTRLIDSETGVHLWVERFDGALQDLFEIQGRVAAQVAGAIEPTLHSAEVERSVDQPTADLGAYDLYLRGHALFLASARQIGAALGLLEEAITRDPNYGAALGLAAMCCQRLVADSRSADPGNDRLKAVDYARRALEAAPNDCSVLVNAALALAYFGEDIDAMLTLVDRALTLNPNFARGWHVSGHLHLRAGLLEKAIEHTRRSQQLSPRARVGNGGQVTIGAAHFYARRFEEAVPHLLQAAQEDPENPNPHRYLAACYACQGKHHAAAAAIVRLRAVTDTIIPDVTYLRHDAYRTSFLEGLALAMKA